jgi:thymidine kinase
LNENGFEIVEEISEKRFVFKTVRIDEAQMFCSKIHNNVLACMHQSDVVLPENPLMFDYIDE